MSEKLVRSEMKGIEVVILEQAAESLTGTDGDAPWKFGEFWVNVLVLEALVGSLGVAMHRKLIDSVK